jgi:hypothetical protein
MCLNFYSYTSTLLFDGISQFFFVCFSHSKPTDDDHSSSSNNSSTSPSLTHKKSRQNKSIKLDENHPPNTHSKRKRKTQSPLASSSSSNPPTIISARGRKIHIKHQSDNESEFDSDISNDEFTNSKRPRSSGKDYQTTLNELHNASEKFIQSNQTDPIKNERFNYQNMTKLSHENLHIDHFRDCLFEQEDHRFLNSMNSYLEQFRQRLLAYFTYMKSDVYREHLRKQLDNEMELNKTLKAKVNCLENNIKALLEDAIYLLKLRTNELGIEELERPVQLINYASDISNKHKELRTKVASLEKEIAQYDHENEKMNFILNNIPTNGNAKQLFNDNVYSTLLVNMSKQTEEQENTKQQSIISPTYLPISPNSATEKHFDFNQSRKSSRLISLFPNHFVLEYNIIKSERKTDFIIQKRAKKTLNPDGPAIVSPIKIIKVTDKHPPPQNPSTIASSIDNLLSTKQLEPVQVHSVVSKQSPSLVQTVKVQTLIHTSPPTKISINKFDEIKSVVLLKYFELFWFCSSQDMTMQSPRKKRDFYGKSSLSSINRYSRHINKTDSSLSNKTRPSSTPACTEVLSTTTLPDRPVSIPPLKTSS